MIFVILGLAVILYTILGCAISAAYELIYGPTTRNYFYADDFSSSEKKLFAGIFWPIFIYVKIFSIFIAFLYYIFRNFVEFIYNAFVKIFMKIKNRDFEIKKPFIITNKIKVKTKEELF